MKKISILALVVLLIIVVALSLVACGEKESPDEIIHNGAFYNGLSEQDKVDFDAKLNTIMKHTDYTILSDDDKLALLNRLVESEILIKEVVLENEQNAVAFDNVKKELSKLSNELNYLFYSDENFVSYFNNLIDSNINFFHNLPGTENMTDDEIMDLLKESGIAEYYYEILILRSLKEEFNADVELMKTFDINIVAEKLNAYISELNVKKGVSEWDEQRGIGYVIDIIEQALKKIEADEPYCSITDVYNAIKDVKDELKEIMDSDTVTAAEIAKAQEKLVKIEKTEQEYVYQGILSAGKEMLDTDSVLHATNPGMSLRKICGIYKYGGIVYVNADLIRMEQICGVDIVSSMNAFCSYGGSCTSKDSVYAEIIESIYKTTGVRIEYNCTNKNADWHKEYWEENKYSVNSIFSEFEQIQWLMSIEESWESYGHVEFIIKLLNKSGEEMEYDIVIYNSSTERYSCQIIEKICPEFWAQAEIENNK